MEYVLSIISFPGWRLRKTAAVLRGAGCHLKDHFIPHARNNYHPHILGHRALALFSAALVLVKIFTVALLSFGPVLPAYSSAITAANIISLTNRSRQEYQLPQLSSSEVLARAAQAKAEDMLARGYFSHNTPDGRTPWSFISAAGYSYLMAGENLAVNFTESEQVENAWMNSPGHKANILNKNFEEIGIGVAQGQYQGHPAVFVVQMFGLPAEQQIKLSEKPTQVQAQPVPEPDSPAVQAARQEPVLESAEMQVVGDTVSISAKTSAGAVKVIAYFGERAVMLKPASSVLWQGQVPLAALARGRTSMEVKAFDINNNARRIQLADFSPSTVENYGVLGAADAPPRASLLGRSFNPRSMEQKVYLIFAVVILSCLLLAIAIKKHIQHPSLVANSAFVVILAMMLWTGG